MTRLQKRILTAVLLASVSAAAIPVLAATTGSSADGQQAAVDDRDRTDRGPAGQQIAFGGPGRHGGGQWGGPRHPGPQGFGPGGPGERGFEQLAERFDTNKDGKISQEEVNAALGDKLKSFDKDADGSLSLQEYQAYWDEQTRDPMVRSFQRLDRDGDAKVTAAELTDRLDLLVQRLDRNNDGVVDASDMQRGPGGHGGPGGPDEPDGPDGPGVNPPPPPPAQ